MMRQLIIYHIAALIASSTFCSICAYPLSQPADSQDIIKSSLINGKEIDVLMLGIKDQEELIADRNKRTIGLLRELFPDITKEIDSIVNRIIAQIIRVAGPGLLNSILSGNRGLSGSGSTTPSNFDAEFFDDNDDKYYEAVDSSIPTLSLNASNSNSQVKIDLPSFTPDSEISTANKQIDEQANRIVSKLLRSLGPTILRTAIQGNSANVARTNFDADFDDDGSSTNNRDSGNLASDNGTRVTIELPTFDPYDDNAVDVDQNDNSTAIAVHQK